MKEANKIDLGSIKVHKRVLAEIVSSTVEELKGVHLVPRDFSVILSELIGVKKYPGITVGVDKNNQVTIEIKVLIQHGSNIPDMAKKIQDAIRGAIEQAVDIDLKDINVNIQGMTRAEVEKPDVLS